MRRIAAAVALALCLVGQALGNETFWFKVTGSAVHTLNWWECECDNPGTRTFPWSGAMHITTTSDADGVYTGNDLLAVALNTNLATFSIDGNGFGGDLSRGGPLFVTLAGGEVTSILGNVEYGRGPYAYVDFDDTALHYFDEGDNHHVGPTEGRAIYTAVAIPEPSTYALVIMGLALVVVLARRRRAT